MKALTFLEYWGFWFYKPRKIDVYYDGINKHNRKSIKR